MSLKAIKVSGYRGFSTPQTIRFAQPSGKPGSGLTLIVGPNNAGKSSVMEVLSYLRNPGDAVEFIEGQKNTQTNGRIRIEYHTSEGNFTLQTTGGGAIKWDNFPSTKPKISAYVVPSRRSIEARFSANPEERSSYVRQSPNFTSRRQTGSRFSSRLSRIDNEQDKFLECLNRILPNPPSWYMEKSDPGRSEFYLKVTSATSPHDSDGLGSGVASAIHVADALYDSPNEDIVGIDEPELSLHPAAQRRLASVLVELSAYRQIIIATHSPFFAPLECLSSGMMVARVYQGRGGSIVGQLEKVTAEKVSNLLKDSNNPHVLGLDAREVLFLEDDVILVEGQEDVVGYRKLLASLGVSTSASFYGWGVGGASKMRIIATFLKELGIQRVFGILDKDHLREADSLSETFPGYQFKAIPAADIRTKEARDAMPAKEGLLDANGVLRLECQDEVKGIFSSMATYFASQEN